MVNEAYTTQLQAGLGLIDETRKLLDLWSPGMSVTDLKYQALESGEFPNVTFRRLRNIIVEAFKPRYLINNGSPASLLKILKENVNSREFQQLLFIYTCRANSILADFVRDVYWNAYSAGRETLSIDDARYFVNQANEDGKTFRPWSDMTITRISRYLTGCCADFGLLESGEKSIRKIKTYTIEPKVAVFWGYDLHFSGLGDNSVLSHPDWALFGMDRADVLNEFKRLALKGYWIIQSAGDVTRIGWQYASMEELVDGFAKG